MEKVPRHAVFRGFEDGGNSHLIECRGAQGTRGFYQRSVMQSPPKSILVVASESETRAVLRLWLEKRGMTVYEASDLETAMKAIFRWSNLAAVICDQRLPDGGAINFLHWMREQLFAVPFLLMAGRPQAGQKRGRGFDVLETPLSGAGLRDALSRVVDLDLVEPGMEPTQSQAGESGRTGKAKRRKSNVA